MSWSAVQADYTAARTKRDKHRSDWELIGRYIAPSRIPEAWKDSPDDPLTHEVVDTTAISAAQRLPSILAQTMFPAHAPWNIPRLEGREPSDDEMIWLDHVQDALHEWFTSRSKSFRQMIPEVLQEVVAFGTGPSYCWSKPFGMPEYRSVSLFNFSYLLDESGQLTHAFFDSKSTRSAISRDYPDVTLPAGDASDEFDIVYAVTPDWRNKRFPFSEQTFIGDDKIPARKKGLKEMPFYAPFFQRRPQEHYGIGPGHLAYPFAKWVNDIQATSLSGLKKSIDPPMVDYTGGAFKKLDRRAGRVTTADWAALGFGDIREALQPLLPSGDLRPGIEMVKDLRNVIYRAFYIDWLESEGEGVRTATEVNDRRALRFQSMSTLISRIIPAWVGPMVERTFRILLEASYFDEMPDTLRNESLTFEYRSPLLSIMDQAETDLILGYAQKLGLLAQLEPTVLENFDVNAAARRIAKNDGLPAELLVPLQKVIAKREAAEAAAQEQQDLAAQSEQASALRDSGQGAAALIGAMNNG